MGNRSSRFSYSVWIANSEPGPGSSLWRLSRFRRVDGRRLPISPAAHRTSGGMQDRLPGHLRGMMHMA